MKIKNYKITSYIIIVMLTSASWGQINVQTNLFIGDQGILRLDGSAYNFGPSGLTETSRTAVNYGKLTFGPSTTFTNASNSHFVDGYARSSGKTTFDFPIGQSGVYAPIRIIAITVFDTDAAYLSATPATIGASIAPTLSAISSSEYWDIIGTNISSKISLSYRATSNVATLTSSDLTRLTIAGWNGTSWIRIPSTVDVTSIQGALSTLTSGSVTADVNVNLNNFRYFTLASRGPDCAQPLIASSGIIKTFNGTTWSPSLPTLADPVVITGAYTSGIGFGCNSLTLNANITLANSQVLEIVNGVTGTGKIVMATEASVIQRNPASAGPNIEMTKITRPMRRNDYVFVGSPINSVATFMSNLLSNASTSVNGLFGTYTESPFNVMTTYAADGFNQVVATPANVPVGKGFSIMVDVDSQPYSTLLTAGAWFAEKYPISIKTNGIANNGDIPVTFPGNGWARIGNPYPSPMDAQKLFDAISTVRKTVYYWTFNTPRTNLAITAGVPNYNNADYSTWNFSGGVTACGTCAVPDGKIATMQSVLIGSLISTDATINLTNCMRTSNSVLNLFKSGETDRFWVNLNGSNNSFSQILLAYRQEGTLGYDDGYDGPKLGGVTTSQLTSLIGTTKYAIQTRPSFFISDQVPLQVDQVNAETLTISLGNKEGIFNTSDVSIYLHDAVLNTYHNLGSADYTYIPTVANESSRFKIVYDQSLIVDDVIKNTNIIALINNESLNIQSAVEMTQVEVFDIIGRKIQTIEASNKTLITAPFFHSEGVYIVKAKLNNGSVATFKLINKN